MLNRISEVIENLVKTVVSVVKLAAEAIVIAVVIMSFNAANTEFKLTEKITPIVKELVSQVSESIK